MSYSAGVVERRIRTASAHDERAFVTIVERLVTLAIVACGFVICVAWALAVPIFENPDEPAHYDYVYQLHAAGHFLLGRQGPAILDTAADPMYGYLATVSDMQRIAFHSDQRTSPGYGRRPWVENVDAHAPRTASDRYRGSRYPIPELVTSYPPGYYAIAALWLTAARALHAGAVEAFLSVRILSALMFAATLATAAALFREARIDRLARLLLLAALAFFPLASFIGASVQPDVLLCLAFSLSIHRLLIARRRPTTANVVLAAACLSLAAFTKPIYAFALLATFLVTYACEAARSPSRRRTTFVHLLVCIAGFAVAFGADRYIEYQPPALVAASLSHDFGVSPLRQAAAGGAASVVHYLVDNVHRDIVAFFFDGGPQLSYWGDFGWLDAPLGFAGDVAEIAQEAFSASFRDLVALLGTLTFCTLGWRLIVLARKEPRRAFSLFGNDIPLTCFLLFDALMIVIAVSVPLGIQGRYWYPVIVLSFLSSVRYAARAIPFVGQRRIVQRAVAAGLCAWSLAASNAAAHTIRVRYYASAQPASAAAPPNDGARVAIGR